MESISATMVTFGVILLLVSWIQLLFVSFKEDYSWGLSTLFIPPVAYLYALFAWEKAGSVIVLSLLGWILILAA